MTTSIDNKSAEYGKKNIVLDCSQKLTPNESKHHQMKRMLCFTSELYQRDLEQEKSFPLNASRIKPLNDSLMKSD